MTGDRRQAGRLHPGARQVRHYRSGASGPSGIARGERALRAW
ncbi:MAG: hypothetical protein MZV65_34110 [Chromatiales bacterium]|nr:hypothetical protein [Chromatiales bacterium]